MDYITTPRTQNALIPIYDTSDEQQAVMGRDLHEFLEVNTEYRHWFPRMVEYGFIEGQDYAVKNDRTASPAGMKERLNHIVTLDMAKEIAMIQRTERGKQARLYFLEVERNYRNQTFRLSEDEIVHQALAITSRKIRELEQRNAEIEPKANAYDQFINGDGSYSIGNAAKMLGLSQNKLFQILRARGVLIAKGAMRNTPYQRYMHHFEVRAYDYTRSDGTTATSYTTRVLPSGLRFIASKVGVNLSEVA